jgi:hypothetical protein
LLRLPTVEHPERYVGLYVYDFGTHAAIGYTAGEIRILRESRAHRDGTAYEIYRVTDAGGYELRGVLDQRLAAREAICFLREDAGVARGDYDRLQETAAESPLPCAVEMQLAEVRDFRPPHTTALLYPAASSNVISGWLTQRAINAGDRAVAGIDAHDSFVQNRATPIAACQLAALLDYHDRSAEEVLRAVDRGVQR